MLPLRLRTRVGLIFMLLLLIACQGEKHEQPFLLTEKSVAIARGNIRSYDWARAVFDSLKKVADDAVAIKPDEIAEWIPAYTPTRVVDCPVCGTFWAEYIWQWSRERPDEILCRVCSTRVTPENYPDNDSIAVRDPQGQVHFLPVHRRNDGKIYQFRERVAYQKLNQVRNWLEALAYVYAVTGEEQYADAAVNFLKRLAVVYPGYALHDWEQYGTKPWRLAGKISGWNYEDATLIIACGKAYDATRNSPAWDPSDRQLVQQGLFRCAVDFLTKVRPDKQIINDTPFRFAGVAIAARILNDATAMRWVLDEELGIVPFILRNWNYDGSWQERAPSYHLMALRKFHEVVDAVEGYSDPPDYRGADHIENFSLKKLRRLQRIYESLFKITYPDGSLPPVNDSHVGDKPPPLLADAAYAWFGSDEALRYLADSYGDSSLSRGNLFSLFHRPKDAPQRLKRIRKSNLLARPSLNVDDLGLIILRSQSKSPETMLTLKYGGIFGGHDHHDKLDLTLFAEGREMLSDLGYVYSYYPKIFTWMQRSLAHNTVTVDGINQSYGWGAWKLFEQTPGMQASEVFAPWIYHTITDVFNRQVILVERNGKNYIVDIFRVSGGKIHDWSVHAETPDLAINDVQFKKVAKITGRDYAYDELTNVKTAPISNGFYASWQWRDDPLATLKLHMISPQQAQLFLAEAPAQRKIGQEDRQLPYLIVRTKNSHQTTFIAVWEHFKEESVLQSVRLQELKPIAKKNWRVVIQVNWKDGMVDFIVSDLRDDPGDQIRIGDQSFVCRGRIGLIRWQNENVIAQQWIKAFSD